MKEESGKLLSVDGETTFEGTVEVPEITFFDYLMNLWNKDGK